MFKMMEKKLLNQLKGFLVSLYGWMNLNYEICYCLLDKFENLRLIGSVEIKSFQIINSLSSYKFNGHSFNILSFLNDSFKFPFNSKAKV